MHNNVYILWYYIIIDLFYAIMKCLINHSHYDNITDSLINYHRNYDDILFYDNQDTPTCIPRVFHVYSTCIPRVFHVYSTCIPRVFHELRMSISNRRPRSV